MHINIGCVLFIFICMMHGATICARSDKHAFSCCLQKPKLPSTVHPPTSFPLSSRLLLLPFFIVSNPEKTKQKHFQLEGPGDGVGSRTDRDTECIVMGSVNPSGLLLNAGWDTTSGSPFHPGALLPVALPSSLSSVLSLSLFLLDSLVFVFFYCLLLSTEWTQRSVPFNMHAECMHTHSSWFNIKIEKI